MSHFHRFPGVPVQESMSQLSTIALCKTLSVNRTESVSRCPKIAVPKTLPLNSCLRVNVTLSQNIAVSKTLSLKPCWQSMSRSRCPKRAVPKTLPLNPCLGVNVTLSKNSVPKIAVTKSVSNRAVNANLAIAALRSLPLTLISVSGSALTSPISVSAPR